MRVEATETKWISPAGRVIRLTMTAVRWDRMPPWLVERLQAHAAKLDWGDEPRDAWEILARLAPCVVWRGEWGTVGDLFVSNEIAWTLHAPVDAVAAALKVSYAFEPQTGAFAFAERAAVWKEKL